MPRKQIPLHFNLFEVELWKAKMKWNNVNRKEYPGKKMFCFYDTFKFFGNYGFVYSLLKNKSNSYM